MARISQNALRQLERELFSALQAQSHPRPQTQPVVPKLAPSSAGPASPAISAGLQDPIGASGGSMTQDLHAAWGSAVSGGGAGTAQGDPEFRAPTPLPLSDTSGRAAQRLGLGPGASMNTSTLAADSSIAAPNSPAVQNPNWTVPNGNTPGGAPIQWLGSSYYTLSPSGQVLSSNGNTAWNATNTPVAQLPAGAASSALSLSTDPATHQERLTAMLTNKQGETSVYTSDPSGKHWTPQGLLRSSNGQPIVGSSVKVVNHANGKPYLFYTAQDGSLQAARLSSTNPAVAATASSTIARPNGTWEKSISAQGVMIHGNTVNLVYAGNNNQDGLLTIGANQDPLQASNWHHGAQPIFTSPNAAQGTFVSDDPRVWWVHGAPGESSRGQTVGFNADGVLDLGAAR